MTQKQEEIQRKTYIVEKIKAENIKNESNPDNYKNIDQLTNIDNKKRKLDDLEINVKQQI